MDSYSGIIRKLDNQRLVIDVNEELNIERLKTFYFGYEGERIAEIKILDPRQFTPQQRKFIFALINDISAYTGQFQEEVKNYFYWQYEALTGSKISLSDVSTNSVDDVTLLTDIVLDFILEWNIPFKNGYDILPQNTEYYLFKCISTRHCAVCGKSGSDIHHAVGLVGMGRNRSKINHLESKFISLCREHHNEAHSMGLDEFCEKYKVYPVGINQETIKRLKI